MNRLNFFKAIGVALTAGVTKKVTGALGLSEVPVRELDPYNNLYDFARTVYNKDNTFRIIQPRGFSKTTAVRKWHEKFRGAKHPPAKRHTLIIVDDFEDMDWQKEWEKRSLQNKLLTEELYWKEWEKPTFYPKSVSKMLKEAKRVKIV
jgi:hypothetical protein